jgi:hypothetical protein
MRGFLSGVASGVTKLVIGIFSFDSFFLFLSFPSLSMLFVPFSDYFFILLLLLLFLLLFLFLFLFPSSLVHQFMHLHHTGHPFDTIKVRLQTEGGYGRCKCLLVFTVVFITCSEWLFIASRCSIVHGPLHCLRTTLQTEGIKGLYKGATPPLFGWAAIDFVMVGTYMNLRKVFIFFWFCALLNLFLLFSAHGRLASRNTKYFS